MDQVASESRCRENAEPSQLTIRSPALIQKLGDQEFMQQLRKVVIIGGCGHVGLPLGIVLLIAGWTSFFSIGTQPR
jgi:hypothetical protein